MFPNGFIEMELVRGNKLVVYGVTDETRKFTLVCDGKRIPAEFDEQGKFPLMLPSGPGKVTVRLEKNGKVYPQFYAAVTLDE